MADRTITRQLSIFINDREVVNSFAGITRAIRTTNNQINNLNAGSETYAQDLDRLNAELEELTTRQRAANAELRGTPGIFQSITNALGPVASGMLAAFSIEGVIEAAKNAISEAFDIVVNFNQKQADLAAIMGKSRTQIRNLTADAIKYGASTAYSATEVSELQTELARLGKTEPEIRSMTKAILNSATALESGLGEAAELVGGQLNSYSADASEAQKYSDIMANSVNISATSFESLSTALPKVSAVAAQEGVTFERLNAILGTLADQNIAAETAGTGFRNILLTSAQAGKPYQEMLDKVKNSTNQTATATEIFGKENATVAVILANSTDKINANTIALENSAGSAEKLAKEKMNSLKGLQEAFSGAWEGFILSIEKGDGVFGKLIAKTYQFGSAILSILTPQRQLSDELRDEQLELNKLVSKITSSNIGNDERKRLLIELKQEYPDFIKNIDIETVSNGELIKTLGDVNNQYVKRIALQRDQEKIDATAEKQAYALQRSLEARDKVFDKLSKLNTDYNLNMVIDYGSINDKALENSAKKIQEALGKKGLQYKAIDDLLGIMRIMDDASKIYGDEVKKQVEILGKKSKALGIDTEAQKANKDAVKETSKIVVDNTAVINASLENQIKQLTYTKNRREAMGQDTYNVESQIYKLQQKLYKDDVDKYEEATNNLLRIQRERREKAEKIQKDADDEAKKAWVKTEMEYYDRYTSADKEITALLKKSQQERDNNRLTAAQKQDAEINQRWDAELEKYKEHADRTAEIEAARDAELYVAKELRAKESAERIRQMELEMQQERLGRIFSNTMYLQQYEAENDMQRAVIKAEREGASQEEIQAIKKKYAERDQQTGLKALDFFINLKNSEVKWSDLTEKQKLALTKQGLAMAADMFETGSAAWKALKIAEATINTVQGAIAAYQAMAAIPIVGPALGIAAAGAITAYGYKQVKAIENTKIPKAAKYFYGGYTGNNIKYADEYGGVAQVSEFHPNEYVIPAKMMDIPAVANTAEWLEGIRTGKSGIPNNSSKIQEIPGNSNSSASGNSADPELKAMLAAITAHLQNPVAPVIVYGYEDLQRQNKMQDEITSSKSNGKLNS